MACETCETLRKQIKAERIESRKLEFESQFRDHINSVVSLCTVLVLYKYSHHTLYVKDSNRLEYQYQCAKVITLNNHFAGMLDCNYSDVSIVADASGGMGTVFHPHYHAFNKNEIQRHQLLKVHCNFVKVIILFFKLN